LANDVNLHDLFEKLLLQLHKHGVESLVFGEEGRTSKKGIKVGLNMRFDKILLLGV